jgi:hypothetical protein
VQTPARVSWVSHVHGPYPYPVIRRRRSNRSSLGGVGRSVISTGAPRCRYLVIADDPESSPAFAFSGGAFVSLLLWRSWRRYKTLQSLYTLAYARHLLLPPLLCSKPSSRLSKRSTNSSCSFSFVSTLMARR